jgi:hypothetical protein
MINRRALGSLVVAGLLGFSATAGWAGTMGPHPIRGWNGNEFLFEAFPQPDGSIYYKCYRARGDVWERVGGTTIRKGQKTPDGSWVQKIWFQGAKLGSLRANMDDPFWRYYPGRDRGGKVLP